MDGGSISKGALFETIRGQISRNYDLAFEDRGSKTLIVVFSAFAHPALRKHPFKYDSLHIADKKLFYYLHNPGKQTLIVQNFITQAGYERVIFLGSSKGGAGALLWSSLMYRRDVKFRIYCMAFSPQAKLYPFNENLASLPTYMGNMKLMETSQAQRVNFETYGNVPEYVLGQTPPTRVIYSSKCRMDVIEAQALSGNQAVELVPLNIAFHGSIAPFVTDLTDSKQIYRLATKLYADAEHDSDLRASLPERKEEFPAMFAGLRCPSLNDYIDQFCGVRKAAADRPSFWSSFTIGTMRAAISRLVAVAVSLGLLQGFEGALSL